MWEKRLALQEWADATLISIPKKSNLNDWWGIALLGVIGKVVARVIQERLQWLAARAFRISMWALKGAQLFGHDLYCPSADGEGNRT